MPIGLHHLRYFVTVAEEGNVSRAADRLHIAQPSLSAQIKYLENHLGTQLFRRHYRGVELDLAEHTFADPSAGLNDGQVDVAFVMPPISHHGLSFDEICHVPRVAVVSETHPLAKRATISVRELLDDPSIVAETGDTICRDFWLATSHRGGKPARLGHTTTSIDKFIQLAVAGEVVGLAAAWVEQAFARPGVRFLPVTDVEPAVTALAWYPAATDPALPRRCPGTTRPPLIIAAAPDVHAHPACRPR